MKGRPWLPNPRTGLARNAVLDARTRKAQAAADLEFLDANLQRANDLGRNDPTSRFNVGPARERYRGLELAMLEVKTGERKAEDLPPPLSADEQEMEDIAYERRANYGKFMRNEKLRARERELLARMRR